MHTVYFRYHCHISVQHYSVHFTVDLLLSMFLIHSFKFVAQLELISDQVSVVGFK